MLPVLENFKIVSFLSCFHFVGSKEKLSRTNRKFVSACLDILYLAPEIPNPYLNYKLGRR